MDFEKCHPCLHNNYGRCIWSTEKASCESVVELAANVGNSLKPGVVNDRISSATVNVVARDKLEDPSSTAFLKRIYECDYEYPKEAIRRNRPIENTKEAVIAGGEFGSLVAARTIVNHYDHIKHHSDSPDAFDGSKVDRKLSKPDYYFPLFDSLCGLLNIDSAAIKELLVLGFNKANDDIQAINIVLRHDGCPPSVFSVVLLMSEIVRSKLSYFFLKLEPVPFAPNIMLKRDYGEHTIAYYIESYHFRVIHNIQESWVERSAPVYTYTYKAQLSVALRRLRHDV